MQVNNIFKINDKIYFEKKSHKKYVNEEFEAQKDYQKINIPFLKAKNNLFSSVLSPNFHNDKVLSIQANAKIEAEQQNLQTEQEKTEQLNTIITTQYEKAAFLDKQMTNMQKSNQIDSSQSPYSPGFAISPKFNLDCIDESQVQLANQQLINNLSQSSVQHKKKIRLSIATKTAQKLQNLKTDQNKKIEQSDNLELKKEVIEKLEDKEINQYFTKKLEKNDRIYFEKSNLKKQIGEEHEEVNNLQSITVPSIMVKSNQISNNTSQSNLNNFIKYEKAQDEIIQFKKPAFELKTTDGNDNDYLIKERVLQSNFIANERFLSPRSGSPSVLDSSRYFSRFKAESSLQASKLSPIKSVRLQRKITLGISQTKVNNQQNQPSQVVESQLPNKDKVLLFQKEVIEKLKKKEINEYFAKKLEIIQSQKVSKSIKNMIFGNKLWKKKDERNDQELDISLKEIIESHVALLTFQVKRLARKNRVNPAHKKLGEKITLKNNLLYLYHKNLKQNIFKNSQINAQKIVNQVKLTIEYCLQLLEIKLIDNLTNQL
ncbi:hypothetical protein ABPG74_007220 [Tetrahymena malaccensis]